jgi:hypothetical protein
VGCKSEDGMTRRALASGTAFVDPVQLPYLHLLFQTSQFHESTHIYYTLSIRHGLFTKHPRPLSITLTKARAVFRRTEAEKVQRPQV